MNTPTDPFDPATYRADKAEVTPAFVDVASTYLRSHGPAALADLRAAVLAAPTYRPDLDPTATAEPLLAEAAYDDVLATLLPLMPGAFFSPSAHLALAAAFDATGDRRRAGRERDLARAALQSILDSGDGTEARPWRVLRVSDEYDVLRASGRRSLQQSLVVRDDAFDRHVCDDGSEAWFEVPLA